MMQYCPDSSKKYECDITPEAIGAQLDTFMNIAKHYGFSWLEETIESMPASQKAFAAPRHSSEGVMESP